MICTSIGLPYNPYHPSPYKRWMLRGMFDLANDALIAEEFWNFLGNGDVYESVLDCFEEVGIELRTEIDHRFSTFMTKLV